MYSEEGILFCFSKVSFFQSNYTALDCISSRWNILPSHAKAIYRLMMALQELTVNYSVSVNEEDQQASALLDVPSRDTRNWIIFNSPAQCSRSECDHWRSQWCLENGLKSWLSVWENEISLPYLKANSDKTHEGQEMNLVTNQKLNFPAWYNCSRKSTMPWGNKEWLDREFNEPFVNWVSLHILS